MSGKKKKTFLALSLVAHPNGEQEQTNPNGVALNQILTLKRKELQYLLGHYPKQTGVTTKHD